MDGGIWPREWRRRVLGSGGVGPRASVTWRPPLASADVPHAVPAGHRAAPHVHLCQQPRGSAHAGAGGRGRPGQPRYCERRRGEQNPSGGEGRRDRDLGVSLTLWGYPLAPTHSLPLLGLPTWERQVWGLQGPKARPLGESLPRGARPPVAVAAAADGALWPHPRRPELFVSRGDLSRGPCEHPGLVLPRGGLPWPQGHGRQRPGAWPEGAAG